MPDNPGVCRGAGGSSSEGVPRKLSGSEWKMLAVARVRTVEPALLVLDEPASNLSPELSRPVFRGREP
jgi:ABC-type branched-subunit amino acid transport system ATPase component